jgi:hypothetical protein
MYKKGGASRHRLFYAYGQRNQPAGNLRRFWMISAFKGREDPRPLIAKGGVFVCVRCRNLLFLRKLFE